MTHRVTMLIYPGVQILDVTGPLEVFARTARWLADQGRTSGAPAYRVELVADRAGPVATSSGLRLVADRACRDVDRTDTLMVAGGIGHADAGDTPGLIDWVRRTSRRSRRVCSVCTGAFLLARAGLLDHRSATTHWAYTDQLRQLGRGIRVRPDDIFVRDGHIYTSAGVTAGMDMALALVESDWDSQVALAVARELVLFLKRPGGQAQFSHHLKAQQAESDRLRPLQLWLLEHLDADLSVPALARRAAMSPRNFVRRFHAEIGSPPARYVEDCRLAAARLKLESTPLPISRIAARCGFGSGETMRRVFVRRLGIPPRDYRARFARAR